MAAGLERCIDVKGSQLLKEDAVVQIYSPLLNNAQTMQVRNTGGKLIITSRLYGNRFGPNGKTSGTLGEVLNGTSPESIALNVNSQAAVPKNVTYGIEASGRSVTYKGKSYPCYYLTTKGSGKNTYLGTQSTANSSPLYLINSGSNRDWFFVPIDQVNDGGLFEIRPMLNTGLALDVDNNGKLNGTNVQVYAANGTNAQKFILQKKSGDIYTLRCVESGRYVDVYAGTAKEGTNVQIFDANSNTRAQEWRVLEYGTTTVNGITGKIVSFGSMVDNSGSKLMMDVAYGGTTSGSNVIIWGTNGTDAQRFVLLPTVAEDPNMPVPNSIGVSNGKNGVKKSYGYVSDETYLRWNCSAAWCADNGTNHYELRWRTRSMDLGRGSWYMWNPWESWTIPAVETIGTSVTSYVEGLMSGYINFTMNTRPAPSGLIPQCRAVQIEVELRSVGSDELSLLHSKSITQTVTIYDKPNITLTSAGWTPGGLLVEYDSGYRFGTSYVTIDKIICEGENILKESVEISGNGYDQSEVISSEHFTKFVPDGAKLQITFRVGYDQQRICDGTKTQTITATYDAGNVDVEPRMEVIGAHVHAIVPHLGSERMWVVYNGKSVECPLIEYRDNDSDAVFEVLYPTNGDVFQLFTEAYSLPDGAQWGTDISQFKFKHTSYAWTDDDGKTLYLNRFVDELPIYSYSHAATYQADNLDNRKFSTVSFAPTNTADLTAYGVLLNNEEHPETVKDFDELVGKHVVFRDIYGGIHNVAVTNVAVSRHSKYDEIVVSMIEESI